VQPAGSVMKLAERCQRDSLRSSMTIGRFLVRECGPMGRCLVMTASADHCNAAIARFRF
jgi:hypothetical protein